MDRRRFLTATAVLASGAILGAQVACDCCELPAELTVAILPPAELFECCWNGDGKWTVWMSADQIKHLRFAAFWELDGVRRCQWWDGFSVYEAICGDPAGGRMVMRDACV